VRNQATAIFFCKQIKHAPAPKPPTLGPSPQHTVNGLCAKANKKKQNHTHTQTHTYSVAKTTRVWQFIVANSAACDSRY